MNMQEIVVPDSLRVLDKPVRAYGFLKGLLERINVHGRNEFVIYPPIRTVGIRCLFPEGLTEQVGGSLRKSVTVRGVMHYRGDEPFPFLAEVDHIETHRPDSELPTLHDLRGMAQKMGFSEGRTPAREAYEDGYYRKTQG